MVSDLHLGAATGVDLLRRPELREPLLACIADGVRRVVILGDGLELREVAVRHAAAHAEPLLREIAGAMGGGEIVLLGGNHDHGLLAGWTEERLWQDQPMALEQRISPEDAGPLGRRLAEAAAAGGATLELAYPGIWIRDDVYGIHGHYADLHTTVPTFERLAAGVMARHVVPLPEHGAAPDDYEAVLAPLYAWMFALAQRSADGIVRAGSRGSARAWVALAGHERRAHPVRSAVLKGGFAGAVAALNAAGVGPVRADLSGAALRRGYLQAMHEVVRRLGIGADHVLFGHTHRAGPWPTDDAAEWRAPGGAALVNTGSWVYQPHFLTGAPGTSPYWPGSAVLVDDEGPPRLVALLRDRGHDALRPAQA